jgi:phosphatidylglycerol:prolipoprotein diacylglycerol transferase
MHPILFRIPLPNRPLMLWWALAAAAVIAIGYAALAGRAKERGTALGALIAAAGAIAAAVVYRETSFQQSAVPIYSYGVMLGTSLVAGWYLTLTLAGRDGLPKEVMANCYVITALSAVVGSRLLYVATNLDEFHSFADLFAFRRGGLAVYGGFLGGYVASWAYLAANRIRLMPWADVAVPSLANGLFITRIGCYLFGCDFGKRLGDDAPGFLKSIGTFPHWAAVASDAGEGAPAYTRHLELYKGTPLGAELVKMGHSFPVHPTQLYESLCGLFLVGLLLVQRRTQQFRGQIFFTFAFGYGYLRFILETLRDDSERGEYGPALPEHVLLPGALLLMSLGLCFGVALGIRSARARAAVRVLAFVPPLVAYVVLRPPSFGNSVTVMLSTSQWIGLVSALLVSYFYAQFWEVARRAPQLAMSPASLGPGVEELVRKAKAEDEARPAETEEHEDEREADERSDQAAGDSAQLSESK